MNILDKISNEHERKIYEKYASELPPFDVVEFARDIGLEVKESNELPENISGFIKKNKEGKVSICVNKKHHANRKRFTVAHELGHYFMHGDQLDAGMIDPPTDTVLNREHGVNNNCEYEANEFGASLLMPEPAFKYLWKKEETTIADIALIFRVSESAVMTRGKLLGLVSDNYGYFS